VYLEERRCALSKVVHGTLMKTWARCNLMIDPHSRETLSKEGLVTCFQCLVNIYEANFMTASAYSELYKVPDNLCRRYKRTS
jgi:hypothetical protein